MPNEDSSKERKPVTLGDLIDPSRLYDPSEADKEAREGELVMTDTGVYAVQRINPVKIHWIDDVIPLKPEQKFFCDYVREYEKHWNDGELVEDFNMDSLQALRNLIDFYDEDEILPIVGAAVSGPLWFLLKGLEGFIFWPIAVGPHGIGKSKAMEAFTYRLSGSPVGHASDMATPFRFGAHMDSTTMPRVYNEAEAFPFDKLRDMIKQGTEFTHITDRGRPDQEIKRYAARMAPMFTANRAVVTESDLRPRLLFIPFWRERTEYLLGIQEGLRDEDPESRKIWEAEARAFGKGAFDENYRKIAPMGKPFAQDLLYREAHSGFEQIQEAIERIEKVLRKHVETFDLRRLYSWAVYSWGILAFNRMCAVYLGDEFLPDRSEEELVKYLAPMIQRLETYNMEQQGEDLVSHVLAWLEAWMVRNTDYHGVIRGDDTIWKLKDGDAYWITKAMLSIHNRENFRDPISTLKEIGEFVAARHGLPLKEVYKTVKFNGKGKQAVLIPMEDYGTGQRTL